MRCNNCGWENPGDRLICEKCNSPLSNCEMREHSVTDVYARRTVNENLNQNAGMPTVCRLEREDSCPECGYPVLQSATECPNCGHALQIAVDASPHPLTCSKCNHDNRADALYCSHCGYEIPRKVQKKEPTKPDYSRKTITPWEIRQSANTCQLSMIKNDDESPAAPLSFSGNEIILNRDNTDSNNLTITSKEQAILTYENKKWYIQDKSEQKTTFVYTTEKVELKSGDILVLGNQRFEFSE